MIATDADAQTVSVGSATVAATATAQIRVDFISNPVTPIRSAAAELSYDTRFFDAVASVLNGARCTVNDSVGKVAVSMLASSATGLETGAYCQIAFSINAGTPLGATYPVAIDFSDCYRPTGEVTACNLVAGLISVTRKTPVTGIWEGLAVDPTDPSNRHETRIEISCDGKTGLAEYSYPEQNNAICDSDLVFRMYDGFNVWNYDDLTLNSRNCADGRVRLTKYYVPILRDQLRFEFLNPDGSVDTEGMLTRTASLICP